MSSRYAWRKVSIGSLLSLLGASNLNATEINCFEFEYKNVPDRSIRSRGEFDSSRWCYLDVNQGEQKATLVFNADGELIRDELTTLVKWRSPNEAESVTVGVLFQGAVKLHKTRGLAISPLPVPLNLADALISRAQEMVQVASPRAELKEQALQKFAEFSRVGDSPQASILRLEEGIFESYLPKERLPFRGYWWPEEGAPLGAGSSSPLGKYDSIVKSWTGANPNSIAWEKKNHSLGNVEWGGHCNGWAASAVLYPEPTQVLWHEASNTKLKPSDLKGMLAEASYCVQYAFYGNRYYGGAGDVLEDIYPADFHQVLTYYISEQRKPIALDYYRNEKVDNHIVSGYRIEVKKDGDRKFKVKAKLKMHRYDVNFTEAIGAAPEYAREYNYTLTVNESGDVTGGAWKGENPDFLWVPLSQKACGWENPSLDANLIEKMMALPPQR